MTDPHNMGRMLAMYGSLYADYEGRIPPLRKWRVKLYFTIVVNRVPLFGSE